MVFAQQLELAAELRRPVSVHLVRAHGKALQLLGDLRSPARSGLPPAVALHSWSGSPELVRAFAALEWPLGKGGAPATEVYFGFSALNCRDDRQRAQAAAGADDGVAAIPRRHLLPLWSSICWHSGWH